MDIKLSSNYNKDSAINHSAKLIYLLNHGFVETSDFHFQKNNLIIHEEELVLSSFEDLQKYVYMANNYFEISGQDFTNGMVIIDIETFSQLPLRFLHLTIKETLNDFREKRKALIN